MQGLASDAYKVWTYVAPVLDANTLLTGAMTGGPLPMGFVAMKVATAAVLFLEAAGIDVPGAMQVLNFFFPPEPSVYNVRINGICQENNRVEVLYSQSGVSSNAARSFQWWRNGYPIPRATASVYRLTQADAGTTIFVVVCLEDSWGTYKGESPSVFISNVNDLPTGTVTITGTVAQNQVLTALSTIKDKDGMGPITYTWVRTATYLNSAYVGEIIITGTPRRDQVLTASSTVVDPDGMGPINYQWNRDGVQIVTGTSYTLGEADVGRYITVTASYTNRVGIVEYATSKATTMVKNFVEITGINRVYETLTATNTLTGVLGPITYTWRRNGVQIATGASYVLSWADEGTYITVSASYSKSVGIIESITTLPITRVQSTLYIEGTLVQGQVLTVINLREYNNTTYAWKRNGVTIATGTSYTLVGADVGTYITVESTSLNYGNSIKMTSVAGDLIAAPAGPPVTEIVGERMKSGPDMWYKLEQNDVGRYISLIATYTDAFDTVETVRSVSTLQVANVNDSPTGTVTITGTPAQYQVLTVTNTINDLDGIVSGAYQWNRNGTAISGANYDNYALTQDDVGKQITVTASYKDLQGHDESVTSAATTAVVHVNTLPTSTVTITGTTFEQYEVLTLSNTLADVDGLGQMSYQWNRNGTAISGATGTTYPLTQADVGKQITVTASYTDNFGAKESKTSDATIAIKNVPDPVTGGAYIIGNAEQDQVLTAVTGALNVNLPGLADVDGLGTFSYQWRRSNPSYLVDYQSNNFSDIQGANGRTYKLTQDDVGHGLKVRVSYTDLCGAPESYTSAVTAIVTNVNDSPGGAVSISAVTTYTEDQVLTVTNTLTDIDGMGLVSYQWKRNGYPISGATDSTYKLTKYEIGKRITVSAYYTDGCSSDEYITSDATPLIAHVNHLLTGDAGISGPPVQYNAIFADTTGLSDPDGMGSITYQWNRNGIALNGANGSSYWLTQDDVDQYITVTVYHRDLQGTVETKTSVVGVIPSNINDLPTGKVTINGLAKQNEWLTITHNLNDLDGMVGGSASAITYQWKTVDYNGTNNIAGATGTSYQLTQGEVDKCIIVTASYTDSHGTPESKTSAQTNWVLDVMDSPTGGVTISGTLAQYQVLTATTAATPTSPALNDPDGINGLYYEWQRIGSTVNLATGPTYTLTGLDVGTRVTATAFYRDNQGREKSVKSPATPTITVGNAPSWVVTLNGIPRINEALFSDVSTILDLFSYEMVLTPNVYFSKISYQWQRNRMDIPGEVKPYYVLTATDTGYKFSVKITLRDELGGVYSITSVESAVIPVTAASYPSFNGAYISGTAMEGCTLTASHNMYDTMGDIFAPITGAVTYKWRRNGGTPVATGSTYELTQSDIGTRISVRAYSALYGGDQLYETSSETTEIINSIDAAPGTVTILGTPTYGNTLSIFHTMYVIDATGWMESVQWKRNGSAINLATGSTYVLTKGDVGAVITVTMKWTNVGGSQYVTSAATASVANANALPSGDITIDGTREKNKLLTANTSTLGDLDGMSTLSYQWKSCANIVGAITSNIMNATSSTYTTNVGDEGKLISVTVSYTDLTNVQESKTSRPILIARKNTLPSGSVIITKTVDGLIASHNMGDVDGMGTVSYQWNRGGYPISGATGSSYTLIPADTGSTITVTASYTDDFGVPESVTSDATAPIPYVNTLVAGVVTVSGLLKQEETLTVNATGLSDPDGKGTLHYQWIRGTENIPQATSSTYKLTQAEVGKTISVKVYYTDLHGYGESKTVAVGAVGATVDNKNDLPTGEVTIKGTIIQGSTLTASHSLDDLDGMGTVTYYWKRNGVQIATGTTYTLLEADVDKIITVTASYTDGYSKQESVISTATARVVNVNDPLVGRVAISGTASQGVTLNADTTGMTDDDGRDIVAYIWMRDGIEISGATGSSYPLVQADVGKQITLTVSYIDLHRTYESSTSLPTAPVGNTNDSPTGILSISGTAKQGLVLTATLSGLSDVDGLGQLSYQWMRNGVDINLATNTTYTLVEADVGKVISVKVSYTDGFYYAESILCNAATSSVINTNDSPTGTVTIHGFPAEYQTLTVTSLLVDPDGLGAITYHWKRNGVHIASGTSYPLTWADVGSKMTVTAVYRDLHETWEGVTSDPTDTIVHVNTPVTGEVTISRTSPVTGEVTTTGTPKQNELLTAITDGLSDVDGLGSFSYQWKSDGVNILDATNSTYTLTQAQVGKTISVTVSYTDLHGNAWEIESKTSAVTAPVVNVNDAPVGEVTISGILQTGQLLTASHYLQDADGLDAISYQWKRGATVIATGSTYTLTLDDVGQYITVVASYTDLQLTGESASVTTNDVITTADNPVTGGITIHGLAKQREILTYSSTLQDIDGIDSIEYIWIGPNDKELGRNTSYTLTQSDVGSTIKVYAVCKDILGRTVLRQSDQTDIVANALDSPTGNVTIDGTPTQKQLLTANTNGISDLDGLTYIFTYQWTSGGVDVSGATDATYYLVEADVGKQITVTVKYTDGFGAHETVTSDPTPAVANWNDPSTGTVTIAGLAQQGKLLTASNTLGDVDGMGEIITYTWIRGDAQIIATGSTYELTQADVGYAIKVVASYKDGHETPESATSAPTDLVTNVNDLPSGLPTIDGIKKQGFTLTVSHTFTDVDGLPTVFRYQWLRNGSDILLLATGSTYTLVHADVGKRISVRVSYKDVYNAEESVTSAETVLIDDSNDSPGGDVTITGTKKQGSTLTSSHTLTDVDGAVGTVSYQWNRNGVAIAIGTTYTLVEADVDQTITVTATYSDGVYLNSKTSDATAPIANKNDPLIGSVSISGTKKQGFTLTALLSDSFTDDDGMRPVSYQWKRNDVDISGAIASTYLLLQADVGKAIKVVASYTDGHDTFESATSAATTPIEDVNDLPSGSVSISGTEKQNKVLTASLSVPFTDADGIASAFSYQWLRNGSDILLATGSTYTLVQTDVGKRISVKVSYTDGFSRTESVTSTETGLIANENDVPGGLLTITPLTPSQGQTLSIYENSIKDDDGLGVIKWQWNRDLIPIQGATGTTYVLTEAEVGKIITLTASYKDLQDTNESVTSNATAAVANVNDPLVGHVMIGGDLTHGQTLTASHTFTDVDGFSTAVSYKWMKNGSIINGAVGSTYLLTPADIGAKMSVTASYTDGHSMPESKTSDETFQIQPIRTGYSLITKGIASVPPTPPVNGKIIIANTSEMAITTSDSVAALSVMTPVEKQSLVKHNVSALLAKYAPSSGSDKLYVSKTLLPFAVTSTATDTVELIDAKSSSVASPLVRVGDASAGAVYIDTVPGNSVMLTYSPDTVAITQTSDTAFTVAINGAAALNKSVGDKILLKSVVLTLGSITAAPNNLPVFVKNAPTTVFEDASYSYTVSVSDADNDTFTVTAPILPSWLTFNQATGTLSCPIVPSAVVGSHAVQLLAEDIWNGKTYYDFTITVQNVPVTGTVTSSASLKYSDLNAVQTPILRAIQVSESDAAVVISAASVNGVDVRSYLQLGTGPSNYTVTVKSGQHAALLTLLRTNPGNVSVAIKITDISTPASPIYVIDTITVLNDSPTTTQQFPSSMTIIEDSSTAYAQSGGTDSVITFSEACSVVLNGTYKDYFMLVATDGTSRTYKLKCKDLASARAILPGTSYSLTVTATSSASALTVTSTSLSVQATNILTTAVVGGAKILTHASLQAYITSSAAIPNIATITLSESDPQSITMHAVTVNGSSVDKTYFTMSGSSGNYVLIVNTSAASQLLTRLSTIISSSSAYSMLMTFQVVEQGGNAFTQTITVAALNNIIKVSLKSAVTNIPSMVSYSVNGNVATVVMNYSATPVIDYVDYIISDANSAVGTRVVGGGIAYDGTTLPTMYVGVSLVKSMVYQSPGEWIVTYYESYSGVTGSQSNTLTLKFSVRGAINFVLSAFNASLELFEALSITGNYNPPAAFDVLPTITLSMPVASFNGGLFQLELTDSNINTLVTPATEAVYFSEKITYYADQSKFPVLKNNLNVLLKDLPVDNGAAPALKTLRQRPGALNLPESMVHELAYQLTGVSLMDDQLNNGDALKAYIRTYLDDTLPAALKVKLTQCNGRTQNLAQDLLTQANIPRELFMQIVESCVGGVDPVTGSMKSSRLNDLFNASNLSGTRYGIKLIVGDTLRFLITISPFFVAGQDVDVIVDGAAQGKQQARTVELIIALV